VRRASARERELQPQVRRRLGAARLDALVQQAAVRQAQRLRQARRAVRLRQERYAVRLREPRRLQAWERQARRRA